VKRFSERERDVMRAGLAGRPQKAIAAELGISINSVNRYYQRAKTKLGASSRYEALRRFERETRREAH